MKKIILVIVVVIFFLFAAVIGSRNTQLVTVNYLVAQSEMNTATLMMIMLLIGFVLGLLGMLSSYFSLRVKHNLLKRKLSKINRDK